MNKIERVRGALAGQWVDRVPASFWCHFGPDEASGSAMARAHLGFYRATDPDYLKVMNDNPFAFPGVGRVSVPRDWLRLKPAPRKAPARAKYLDGLKEILDNIGDECMVIVTMFNAFATANDNMLGYLDYSDLGFERITAHLREDPRSTMTGLSVLAESICEFTADCLELGVSGLFLSANGGERDRFASEHFEEYVAVHDRMILQAALDAGSEFNLLHMCGGGLRMDAYKDYPAHAVNWATQANNPSLADGRNIFSQTLVGGMDQAGALVTGAPEDVESEVRLALAEAGGLNFILGAGCALVGEAPTQNLAFAREALMMAG